MSGPFALAEGFSGPPQPSGQQRIYEEEFDGWSGPFMMSVINTKVVHRSNFLSGRAYGDGFVYDEMILLGPEPGEEPEPAAETSEPVPDEEPEAAGPSPDDVAGKESCSVTFLAAVPKFLGLKGEVHGPFSPGDTAELPGKIASVLMKKKRVEVA